jgi:signal transduction histidine kinase
LKKPVIIGDVSAESRSILASVGLHVPAVVLPLISEGEPLGALIVMREKPDFRDKDISRLQVIADLAAVSLRRAVSLEQLEQRGRELEKALESRKELLRILAHDLRNPVNTITMAAAVICKDHPNTLALQKLKEIMERSTNRMNRLIQDLLDSAVIEHAGGLPINPQPHPAHSLAQEVCEISRVHAKAKTVQVECQVEGEATVYADRERLLQVLANLIDNAIKFTPSGGRVTVRSEVQRDHVIFSVSDNGPGIPEAYRRRIFEPYFQAPETAHLGSGLGLAIAKQIVEQHGGNIWVESSEDQGSRFVFTIPSKQIAA